MATQTYTNGVTLTDAGEFDRFDSVAYSVLTSVAGTNTITATGPASYTYAATRPPVWFIPAVTNTGATTVNITPSGGSALGAKNVFSNGAACVGGELQAGIPVGLVYDGTQLNIVGGPNQILLGTEQASTSGTTIDFTGIPAGTKQITVSLVGVSTNGTSIIQVQLGDAGGFETSGYSGAAWNNTGGTVSNYSAGFLLTGGGSAAALNQGSMTLTLEDSTDNTWSERHVTGRSDNASGNLGAGTKSLSAGLTQLRITTVNGTDAFDAGGINISYET